MKKEYYQKAYDLKTWLNIHISQLSYTRNLILVLSIAALGFAINYHEANIRGIPIKNQLKISVLFLVLSIVFGLIIAFLESENYRLKRKISRIIEQNEDFEDTNSKFIRLQNKCTTIEQINRFLFYSQLISFGTGIIILSILIL